MLRTVAIPPTDRLRVDGDYDQSILSKYALTISEPKPFWEAHEPTTTQMIHKKYICD
jgi:hypothetical protein